MWTMCPMWSMAGSSSRFRSPGEFPMLAIAD
jgi:hypothetical protein